jgi:putative CocE/NonD family hydrolase
MTRFPPVWLALGRTLAGAGYGVVVQDVRGRYESEGRFTPFVHEAPDGEAMVRWIAEQNWFDGRLALAGLSYPGYAAWAALPRAGELVKAVIVALVGRDFHTTLYPGGALAASLALGWGVGLGERTGVAPQRLDLQRALRFRPLLEADRVALRETPWYRDWLTHPRFDAYWSALVPELPTPCPPTLLLGGWYDVALAAQLDDYAKVRERAQAGTATTPHLLVGPWARGGLRARGAWRQRLATLRLACRESLAFLDRHVLGDDRRLAPVRLFVGGGVRWREAEAWPPREAEPRRWHLRSGGNANTRAGDGRLDPEPAAGCEPCDRFRYDPSDPVPSRGGALLGADGGPRDQRPVEGRQDVLCYTTDPLAEPIEITGPVRVALFVTSSARDTDFTAKLVDVEPGRAALNLCEGIVRTRWRKGGSEPLWLEPERPVRITIDLGGIAHRFGVGHRLRLEISSSSFPRFDCNPNGGDDPARVVAEGCIVAQQTVLHDAEHPSHLEAWRLPA